MTSFRRGASLRTWFAQNYQSTDRVLLALIRHVLRQKLHTLADLIFSLAGLLRPILSGYQRVLCNMFRDKLVLWYIAHPGAPLVFQISVFWVRHGAHRDKSLIKNQVLHASTVA